MALPRFEKSGYWKPIAVGYKLYFGGEPSPAISGSQTYSVVFTGGSVPFLSSVGPPDVERLARIVVLFTLNWSQSM